jgi:hypothetical protein
LEENGLGWLHRDLEKTQVENNGWVNKKDEEEGVEIKHNSKIEVGRGKGREDRIVVNSKDDEVTNPL